MNNVPRSLMSDRISRTAAADHAHRVDTDEKAVETHGVDTDEKAVETLSG